jgi:hypothetical protein
MSNVIFVIYAHHEHETEKDVCKCFSKDIKCRGTFLAKHTLVLLALTLHMVHR